MTIEVWQMVQIKKVLDTFCTERKVRQDDAAALDVCDQLLRATSREIDNAEQLFNHLSATIRADCSGQTRAHPSHEDIAGEHAGSNVGVKSCDNLVTG